MSSRSAQLIERQIKSLQGVIQRADQKLKQNSGGAIGAVLQARDALAELLAYLVERGGVTVPDRQDTIRIRENVDFVNVARRVRHPGDDAELVAPDIHPAGLAEPQRPADFGTLQSHFAQKLSTGRFVTTKNVEPEKTAALNVTAHVGGVRRLPHT